MNSDYKPMPDWADVFAKRPELEAPGYQEAKKAIADKVNQKEMELIRQQMQDINKEKISTKNKNRSKAKRSRGAASR